jgi:hypothetical protein
MDINGVNVGENWRKIAEAQGAHIDEFDHPYYRYQKQLVITDPAIVAYLSGKMREAAANDPIDGQIGGGIDGSNSAHQANEIVLRFYSSDDLSEQGFAKVPISSQFHAEIRTYKWEERLTQDTFRRYTDMSVRFVRDGYQEVVFVPGLSGDPDSYMSTGRGWREWEIANWTLRGVHKTG